MRCLKIADEYVRLILAGKKTWEIRLRPNTIEERIAIGSTKTKKVEGYVNLNRSQKATVEQLLAHPEKHQASEFIADYAKGRAFLYYWPVSKPEVEREPYPYSFSTGSWCKADKVMASFRPHFFHHNDLFGDNWREVGPCAACGNPAAKPINKVFPSGNYAKYFGFVVPSFVCTVCTKEADDNHCDPSKRKVANKVIFQNFSSDKP